MKLWKHFTLFYKHSTHLECKVWHDDNGTAVCSSTAHMMTAIWAEICCVQMTGKGESFKF
jgi:hypothetical protein